MIRFICVAIFLVVFLILSIPVFFVEWLIGKKNRETRDFSSLRIVQWGFRCILRIAGVETTVIGLENVPDEPVLFIGNHRSYFDILLTYSRCKRLTGYVAKKEMEKIPLLSTWMKYLYCLFLDRHDPKQGMKTILTAIDYIKRGISICIFPEGTRNSGEELSLLPLRRALLRSPRKPGAPSSRSVSTIPQRCLRLTFLRSKRPTSSSSTALRSTRRILTRRQESISPRILSRSSKRPFRKM